MAAASQAKIGKVQAKAYCIPTDKPEADGTFQWSSTTLVVVTVQVDDTQGLGYTYSDSSIVGLVEGVLQKAIENRDGLDVSDSWRAMNEPYEISDGRDSRPWRFRPWMSRYGMPKRSS